MQDDEDIEEVIKGDPQLVPYLLVIKSRESLSYCVVVEKQPFMEPSTFAHAFVALMAAYCFQHFLFLRCILPLHHNSAVHFWNQ